MLTKRLSFSALALTILMVASSARADNDAGSWTMRSADQPGKVTFGLAQHGERNRWNTESDWPVGEFTGLDTSAAKHDVRFSISRDAGRFDCAGYLEDGAGAGTFHFTPNPTFARDMAALGFPAVDAPRQIAMAAHDVSLAFAREVKSEKLANVTTDKLMALRIFNVDPQFIHAMRGAGLTADDADKLIAFRVHGVSPKVVQDIRAAGVDADENELIAFRVHGVSPEFVHEVEALGYSKPQAQQLISMKIFHITPQYVSDMKSRAGKDLTIDQLVKLKVGGVN